MSQETKTRCDICHDAETVNPREDGWFKQTLHPWEPGAIEDQGAVREQWQISDVCPGCADKFKAVKAGELTIVFRKPRGKA